MQQLIVRTGETGCIGDLDWISVRIQSVGGRSVSSGTEKIIKRDGPFSNPSMAACWSFQMVASHQAGEGLVTDWLLPAGRHEVRGEIETAVEIAAKGMSVN